MTQSILLVALLYGFVSVATTIGLVEFGPRTATKRAGAGIGNAGFALGSALFGAALASRGISLEALFEMAAVVAALVATGYAGFFLDGAPVDIPLAALGIVLLAALVHRTGNALVGAVAGVPFLAGMVWPPRRAESVRDAAVSALGGALLGFGVGLGVTIVGACAAFVTATQRRARNAESELTPHFAPYIAVALVVAATLSAIVQTP